VTTPPSRRLPRPWRGKGDVLRFFLIVGGLDSVTALRKNMCFGWCISTPIYIYIYIVSVSYSYCRIINPLTVILVLYLVGRRCEALIRDVGWRRRRKGGRDAL